MTGVWLMTEHRHWWLCNVADYEAYEEFITKHYDKLQPGHYFNNCRPVTEHGDGGKCDLRAKWGFSLRDYSDEALGELFVEFRMTMLGDERFAEWLVRRNVAEIMAVTSL